MKLDRSFVEPMEGNTGARAVVRAAIDMAHALGKYVVAEGVENDAQLELLAEMRCDYFQGFYLSAALPVAQFAALLERERV